MRARPARRPGGGAVWAVLIVALVWLVDTHHPPGPHPARPRPAATSPSSVRPPAGLSFTTTAGCAPAGDYASPRLDRRVRQLLERAAARHSIRVSCLRTGHSWYVRGTRRVSNHSVWRAVDVDMVDGHPVSPSNPAARELALWVGQGRAGVEPSEVGSPWPFGGWPWFSDGGHQDHLHVGFDGPTRAGWPAGPLGVLGAVAAAWWALRRRRPRDLHRFQVDWDQRGVRPGYRSAGLRAWCAHPSCPFDWSGWDDEEAKARQAFARFHRGGGR